MHWLGAAFLFLALDPASAWAADIPPRDAARLEEAVARIRSADYRGERDELRRLAAGLDAVREPSLAAYRDYWRGFALWRRAINGFNETPTPADLGADLEGAVRSFRGALSGRPGWTEARLGIVGCQANLLFLAGQDQAKRDAILAEFLPVFRELAEKDADNPRVLWLVGGSQLSAPPPYGGDVAKAAATYRRGLQAAREEALRAGAQPAWVPAWGAPEHLMSLAFVYSQGALADRSVAQAYADGTLAMVPDWHYVRDVLVPKIQAMPAPGAR